MSENKKIVGTISLEEGMAKFIDNNDVKLPATIWLDYYKQKLKESKQTFRDNGFEIIENALKALEIIKEKKVNLEYLKCCESYEQYKTICSYWEEITQKEFDLLKEVLL